MAPSTVTIERLEQNVASRMGEDAAWTMLSASQYLPHFLVGIGLNVVWPLIGIATGRMPLWLSIVGSVCMLIGFAGTVLLFSTHLVRVRRAARQAYEYLGRPQCRRGMVPRYVMTSLAAFDSWMVINGIPQRGDYESLADPRSYEIAERRRAKREASRGR